jgi:4-carboxymuconolactone decarboxylase
MHRKRPPVPRVLPIPRVLERAAEVARESGSVARPLNMQATLHYNKVISKALGELSAVFFDPAMIPPRIREIAILRMAWNVECKYEFGQHRLFGRSVGLTDTEMLMLTRPISVGSWTREEAAVVQMVDDLYSDDCISEATWEELGQHFDTASLLAIMAAPLCYRMLAGIFNSLGIELDDGVPGWPEDLQP